MVRKVDRFLKDGWGHINIGLVVLLAVFAVVVSVSLVATQPWRDGGPSKASAQVAWWCAYWPWFPQCATPTPTDTPVPPTATPVPPTATDTPVPPTATDTPVPGTATPKVAAYAVKGPAQLIGGGTGGEDLASGAPSFVPMFEGNSADAYEKAAHMMPPPGGAVTNLTVVLDGVVGAAPREYAFVVIRNDSIEGLQLTSLTCTIGGSSQTVCKGSGAACAEFDWQDQIAVGAVPSVSPDPVPAPQPMRWSASFWAGWTCAQLD